MENENEVSPYERYFKMRCVGLPDVILHHIHMDETGHDEAVIFPYGLNYENDRTWDTISKSSNLDLNKSLQNHYSNEAHLSGVTYFNDPLLRAVLTRRDTRKPSISDSDADTGLCQICFERVSDGNLVQKCQMGMAFCVACVSEFLEGDIKEARVSRKGCDCLCRSCESFFSPDEVAAFVSTSAMEKFVTFRNNKLVEESRLNLYCPNRSCGSVVTLSREGASRAKCLQCKTKFCAKCSNVHNRIVTCDWAADSGFRKWKGTTPDGCKRCPSCRMFIEKNGGCMHMTCNGCRHEFCWLCNSPWIGRCSSGKLCFARSVIRSEKWSTVPVVRESLQTVTITAGVAVGVSLAGAAVGVVAAGAAIAVGLVAPAIIVGGTYKGAKKLHKKYVRFKRKRTIREFSRGTVLSPEELVEISDELKWGIRVNIPLSEHDMRNDGFMSNSDNCFMGMVGRLVEGIFISYPDISSKLGINTSPILYLLPSDVDDDAAQRVAGWSMAEVSVGQFEDSDMLLDLVSESILDQLTTSYGRASIRKLYRSSKGVSVLDFAEDETIQAQPAPSRRETVESLDTVNHFDFAVSSELSSYQSYPQYRRRAVSF